MKRKGGGGGLILIVEEGGLGLRLWVWCLIGGSFMFLDPCLFTALEKQKVMIPGPSRAGL